jgi:hypothetical protein
MNRLPQATRLPHKYLDYFDIKSFMEGKEKPRQGRGFASLRAVNSPEVTQYLN